MNWESLSRRARSLAHKHGVNWDDAEDVGQQVVIAIWRKHAAGEPISNIDGLLAVIAMREAIRFRSSPRMRRERTDIDRVTVIGPAKQETRLLKIEQRKALERGIGNLERGRRNVITRWLAGQSNEEVGAAMGIGTHAAACLKWRAIQALRKQLLP